MSWLMSLIPLVLIMWLIDWYVNQCVPTREAPSGTPRMTDANPLGPFRTLLAGIAFVLVSVILLAGFGFGMLVGWFTEGWFGLVTLGIFSYITAFRLEMAAIRGITFLVTPTPPEVGWSRGVCGVLQR